MLRIIFIRHAEPIYWEDCLTEEGKLQAEQLEKCCRSM